MAAKKKSAKKAVKKKPAAKKRNTKKIVKKKKTVKKIAKKKSSAGKKAKKSNAAASTRTLSLVERRRALRKRRRTMRLKNAGTAITSVSTMAGMVSKSTVLTHTRLMRKGTGHIGVLPIDKNVMIKALIQAGSIDALAKRFGVTKQAIGGWFGRRGLQAIDVTSDAKRKKEII